MENRARTRFLTEVWSAYPAADNRWLDVGEFLSDLPATAVVCGRIISSKDGSVTLFSNGASLEFAWDKSGIHWISPQKKEETPHPELFVLGDLIAARFSRAENPLVADGVLVLFPTQDDAVSAQVSFTSERSLNWQRFIAHIRDYFTSQQFIEMQTPTLVPSPGTEPFLDPFSTEWKLGSESRRFYLPTSPEFHLKKLLVRGWTRIFEIKTCFRNGEAGAHHQPEFTMLEWYRAYSDLDRIAADLENLLVSLVRSLRPDLRIRVQRTTMQKLFSEHLGFRLMPQTSLAELRGLAEREGVPVQANDTWNDIFFRIFLEKIERSLGADGPCIVRGYPPSQAALSRIGNDGFADRFELYWRGLEIANAFHELNDPAENLKRFAADAEEKAALGKPAVPRDEELTRDLKRGMPPSGGIALGVDRLFMALFEIEDIAATRAFPLIRLY